MEINVQQQADAKSIVIAIAGRINTATSVELATELQKHYATVETMVLDFSGVEYVSSAGLRMLIDADNAMADHGKLVLRHVGEEVREVLNMTGFNEILQLED